MYKKPLYEYPTIPQIKRMVVTLLYVWFIFPYVYDIC